MTGTAAEVENWMWTEEFDALTIKTFVKWNEKEPSIRMETDNSH